MSESLSYICKGGRISEILYHTFKTSAKKGKGNLWTKQCLRVFIFMAMRQSHRNMINTYNGHALGRLSG